MIRASETRSGKEEESAASSPLGLRRPEARQKVLALAALAAALFLLRWDACLSLDTAYLGGWDRDAGLYVWLAKAAPRALDPSRFFETQAFHPYGKSLAWSDNFVLPALAIGELRALGLSEPLSYNLILLGASLLGGYFTFLCAYALTGATAASLFSGLCLVASPYLGGHLGHPQLQFALWLPLSLLLLLLYLDGRSARHALSLGFVTCCAFLTTVNYALISLLALAVFSAFLLVLRPALFAPRPLAKLILLFSAGASPLLAFVPPYLEVRHAFGERALYEAYYFSASALSWISAPPWSLPYSFSADLSHSEAHLLVPLSLLIPAVLAFLHLAPPGRGRAAALAFFALSLAGASKLVPGVLPRYVAAGSSWLCVALLLRYAVGARSKERLRPGDYALVLSASAATLALLSLGPLGNPEKGELAAGIYRLAYEFFPGLPSIRAVGRIGLASHMFLWLLAALFLASRTKLPAVAALSVCLIVEGSLSDYPLEPAAPPREAFRALCEEQGEGAAIVLPFSGPLSRNRQVASWSEFARLNVRYMNWSAACPGRQIVNGYSGQRSKAMLDLPAELAAFPDARSLAALSGIAGLRYVILTGTGENGLAEARARAAAFEIHEIFEGKDGSLLFVLPPIEVTGFKTLSVPPSSGRLTLRLRAASPATVTIEVLEPNEEVVSTSLRREIRGEAEIEIALPKPLGAVRPQRVTIRPSSPVLLDWSRLD